MKICVALVLILLGFSIISLGSYLLLVYNTGSDAIFLPYPSYSTEQIVTGVLTSENPNFAINISYYRLYDDLGFGFGVTPHLKQYPRFVSLVSYFSTPRF
ncbi:MAG: hypothetical protein ACUVXA_19445, partial [Candidatus Jordarchaeum sp.]|uniref:hypothetical protein n=1 Tax=Candidatus Jordarchaeum sp. TaxID=2823881 RepID=UPI004048EF5C